MTTWFQVKTLAGEIMTINAPPHKTSFHVYDAVFHSLPEEERPYNVLCMTLLRESGEPVPMITIHWPVQEGELLHLVIHVSDFSVTLKDDMWSGYTVWSADTVPWTRFYAFNITTYYGSQVIKQQQILVSHMNRFYRNTHLSDVSHSDRYREIYVKPLTAQETAEAQDMEDSDCEDLKEYDHLDHSEIPLENVIYFHTIDEAYHYPKRTTDAQKDLLRDSLCAQWLSWKMNHEEARMVENVEDREDRAPWRWVEEPERRE